jgi:predicted amidohydrolase
MAALELIRARIDWCEAQRVEILCCPEAVLGGLADYADDPVALALSEKSGQLREVLKPLASDTVTTIVGFTEISAGGHLYNSAAIVHKGAVVGVYRKVHPAIRRSVYRAGDRAPVFRAGGLTFGILICNDSNFPELAREMASQGATTLFVPSNTGLPPERADVVAAARAVDISLAKDNHVTVIRADVAGRIPGLVSYGSSGIVDPDGTLRQSGRRLEEDLLTANLGSNLL